jgi:hypothetical protein
MRCPDMNALEWQLLVALSRIPDGTHRVKR